MRRLAAITTVCAAGAASCVPSHDVDPGRVDAVQWLAVRAEPPEVRPGDGPVTLTAFVAGPDGTTRAARVAWAWCMQARTPTDTATVSPECLRDGPWIR